MVRCKRKHQTTQIEDTTNYNGGIRGKNSRAGSRICSFLFVGRMLETIEAMLVGEL